MFIGKGAFKDCKTVDALLNIEPSKGEMFLLEWELSVRDTPLY